MSGETSVAVKAHSSLGASKASRWMACPGSVRMEAPMPDETSEFAQEGTRAHAVAELVLRAASPEVSADNFVGMEIEGGEVTEEMAEFVQLFVDYCAARILESTHHWIEHRFSLDALQPPLPMFGTSDVVVYDARTGELEVIDLKFGQGVKVEAKNNKQLKYYALGTAMQLQAGLKIRDVKMTIVQPRVAHPDGIIRSDTMGLFELLDFSADLLDAAHATQKANAPLHAGDHCRFCKASAMCPEQLRQAQAVAQIEFANLPEDEPPPPDILPLEVLVDLLPKLPRLEAWIKSLNGYAQRLLEEGVDVPGYKLVQRRAQRKWKNEESAQDELVQLGYKREEYLDMSLRSPAQIEKLLGKKNFKAIETEHVHKVSSGVTMAPVTDPRPVAKLDAGDEFAAIAASV